MAVKHFKRVMQNLSYLSPEHLEKGIKSSRRSTRSGLYLSNVFSPKAIQNKKFVQNKKGSDTIKNKLKRFTRSSLKSSLDTPVYKVTARKKNCKEAILKEIQKAKRRETHVSSLSPSAMLMSDVVGERREHKIQLENAKKFNQNLSQLSLNASEICILTRSRRKSMNLNINVAEESKNSRPNTCSIINSVRPLPKVSRGKGVIKRKNSKTNNRKQTSSPSSSCLPGNSLDACINSTQQNKYTTSSVYPIPDCIQLCHKSEKKVKHKSQISSDVSPKFGKNYHLRSQSENVTNRLEHVLYCKKRMKSLPIDDLISASPSKTTSKSGNCKRKIIPNEVLNISHQKSTHQGGERVQINSKKPMKKKEKEILPRKISYAGKQTISVDFKDSNNNNRSGIINSLEADGVNKIKVHRKEMSSVLVENNMGDEIFSPPQKIHKQSKRHTFPVLCKDGKYIALSSNRLKINQETCENRKLKSFMTLNHCHVLDSLKNVPIDDLTASSNLFNPCVTRSSGSNHAIYLPVTSDFKKVQKPLQAPLPKKGKKYSKSEKKSSLAKGIFQELPRKGTLKRKRWFLEKLKQRNEEYEDDLFEAQKFDNMKANLKIVDDESDTTDISIRTPKCGFILSPSLPKKTPSFKECISSVEFLKARKIAEEYIYRRNKKFKSLSRDESKSMNETNNTLYGKEDLPEKKKLEYSEVMNNVMNAKRDIEKFTQEESEDEDAYFSEATN